MQCAGNGSPGGNGGGIGPGPGLPTGAPPKPAPNGAPVNAFANVDPRLPQILLGLFPGYTPSTAAAACSPKSNFFALANSVQIFQYCTNCRVGNLLYQYLEDQIVMNNDNGTYVTSSM
jgi:hypothetical protein